MQLVLDFNELVLVLVDDFTIYRQNEGLDCEFIDLDFNLLQLKLILGS